MELSANISFPGKLFQDPCSTIKESDFCVWWALGKGCWPRKRVHIQKSTLRNWQERYQAKKGGTEGWVRLFASCGRDPLDSSQIQDWSWERKGTAMAWASKGLIMDIWSQKPIPALALEKWGKDTHTGFTGLPFSRDCERNLMQACCCFGSGRYKGRKGVKWASRGMFWKSLFLCYLIAEFFWPPCSWSSV